jgi:hypothetical protein
MDDTDTSGANALGKVALRVCGLSTNWPLISRAVENQLRGEYHPIDEEDSSDTPSFGGNCTTRYALVLNGKIDKAMNRKLTAKQEMLLLQFSEGNKVIISASRDDSVTHEYWFTLLIPEIPNDLSASRLEVSFNVYIPYLQFERTQMACGVSSELSDDDLRAIAAMYSLALS